MTVEPIVTEPVPMLSRRQIIKNLITEEGARYGVTYAQIMGKSRHNGGIDQKQRGWRVGAPLRTQPIVQARWSAWERVRVEFNKSYPEIGVIFKRDHTSCHHGIREHRKRNRFLPVPVSEPFLNVPKAIPILEG